MTKIAVICFCLGIIFSAESSPLENSEFDENAARNFIKETSEEFISLYNIMAQKAFEMDDKNFIDALMSTDLLEQVAMNLAEMSAATENFPYETFQDDELKSGMRNLRTAAYLYVLQENYFNKFVLSTNYLQNLATHEKVCEYKNEQNNCELTYYPDIAKIISTSNDNEELKYYWAAWRDTDKDEKLINLKYFIDWFDEAARLTNVSPLALWYHIYNDEKFIIEMEKVMDELLPLYKKLHAYIRYSLVKVKGKDVLPSDGLIPHHLIEQVLAQNWKNKNNIELPYPEEELVQLDDKIAEKQYNARQFVEIANNFYQSIGFEELPRKFWEEDFKSFPENTTKSNCRAEIFDMTPSPYLKYCPQTDFRKFLQNHAWMSSIHYANQKKHLPFAYFQSYKFATPVGEAVLLSASTPKYLENFDIISRTEYTEKKFLNRLFKMAVHTIINLPTMFINSKILNDLLSGEVQVNEVNQHYWNLMKKYAGVMPPVDRPEGSIDFSDKFYEKLEHNFHTEKFVSEILGYQIYRGLCEKSGLYTETDSSKPLHNCNFYASTEAGNALKEMMAFGSRKPWREVLKVVTGDGNGLCAHSMLKYYEPLMQWLDETIQSNNIPQGW